MKKQGRKFISALLLSAFLMQTPYNVLATNGEYLQGNGEEGQYLQGETEATQESQQENWVLDYYSRDNKSFTAEELLSNYDESLEGVSGIGTDSDRGVLTLEYRTTETGEGLFHQETLKMQGNTENEAEFISRVVEAIRPFIQEGFQNLWDTKPTVDYIYAGEWGRYLEPFYGKRVSEYSNTPLVLPFEDVTYRLRMTSTETRQWVNTKLLPKIQEMIEQESLAYPLYEFKYELPTGVSLVDFDNSSLSADGRISQVIDGSINTLQDGTTQQNAERSTEVNTQEIDPNAQIDPNTQTDPNAQTNDGWGDVPQETTEQTNDGWGDVPQNPNTEPPAQGQADIFTTTQAPQGQEGSGESYPTTIIRKAMPITGFEDRLQTDIQAGDTASSQITDLNPTDNTDNPNNTLVITNAGNRFGFTLHQDYINILKGYHGELVDFAPVVSQDSQQGLVRGHATTKAYIAKIRNLKDLTLQDKKIGDFTFYSNTPAIDLKTKRLVTSDTITSQNSLKTLSEIGIDQSTLVLVNTLDGPLLVETKYGELIEFGGYTYETGNELDLKPFFQTGTTELTFLNGIPFSLEEYVDETGMVKTEDNYHSNQAIDYKHIYAYKPHLDWQRVVDWAFNRYKSRNDPQLMGELEQFIQDDLRQLGLEGNWNSYLQGAGQITETTRSSIPLVVGGIVILLALIITLIIKSKIRKKKKQQLLFDDGKYMDDFDKQGTQQGVDDVDFDVF